MQVGLVNQSILLTFVLDISQTNRAIGLAVMKSIVEHAQMRKLLEHLQEMPLYKVKQTLQTVVVSYLPQFLDQLYACSIFGSY